MASLCHIARGDLYLLRHPGSIGEPRRLRIAFDLQATLGHDLLVWRARAPAEDQHCAHQRAHGRRPRGARARMLLAALRGHRR